MNISVHKEPPAAFDYTVRTVTFTVNYDINLPKFLIFFHALCMSLLWQAFKNSFWLHLLRKELNLKFGSGYSVKS